MSRCEREPNFFVVGAPKAGTTALYRWLGRHPAVFMSPIKEPCFFAPEVVDYTTRARRAYEADAADLRRWLDGPRTTRRDQGIVLDWADYLSLFRDAGNAIAVGEASGNYLQSATAPAAIRRRIPGARIVMVLRNPADRLFSQYSSAVGAGQASGAFAAWIEEQARLEAGRQPRFGPIWTGMYACHLRRYLEVFPAGQVRIYLYEDYRTDPAGMLTDLLTWLGVDADDPADATEQCNVTTVPRWPALRRLVEPIRPMLHAVVPDAARARLRRWHRVRPSFRPTPPEWARLADLYADDVLALQALIGRDLSAWQARTA